MLICKILGETVKMSANGLVIKESYGLISAFIRTLVYAKWELSSQNNKDIYTAVHLIQTLEDLPNLF